VAKPSKTPKFKQIAAIPWRLDPGGSLRILLITTRETGRWIVPRGWPIRGMTAPASAETEAFEEAGVTGVIGTEPIGEYVYEKRFPKKSEPVLVEVYDLKVEAELANWPEQGQREARWMSASDAIGQVQEAGLKTVLQSFADRRVP
jgi:8-oxo-dGTP pyrophosphatase MutT (NUDIX family)